MRYQELRHPFHTARGRIIWSLISL